MKKIILLAILSFNVCCFSQDKKDRKLFYLFTVNGTFAQNDNYGEYDYYTGEKDNSFLALNAVLIRTGFDIKFNKLLSTGLKIGLDAHLDPDILAVPYYLDTKITISAVDDDVFYVSGGVGKLLKVSDAFEKGRYYKIGIGYHISTEKAHKFILNLDFHQKNMVDIEGGKLQSLSLGMGMLFL